MEAPEEENHGFRERLREKQDELKALQFSYDEFLASSRELEEELEKELEQAQQRVSALADENADLTVKLEESQAKFRSHTAESAALQDETSRLKTLTHGLDKDKHRLEQDTDRLEEKVRILEASEDVLRHQLDGAIEEKIFLQNDLEDLDAKLQHSEQELRSQVADLQQELAVATLTATAADDKRQQQEEEEEALGERPTISLVANGSPAALLSPRGFTNEAEELIQALEEEVELLTQELEDEKNLTRELTTHKPEAAEGAEQELTGVERVAAQNRKLEKELEQLREMNEEMEKACDDAADEVMEKNQEQAAVEETLQEREQELEVARALLKTHEDKVAQVEGQKVAVEAMVEDLHAELNEKSGKVAELQSLVDGLQSKLTASQRSLEEARDSLEEEAAKVEQLTHLPSALPSVATTAEEVHQHPSEEDQQGEGQHTGELSPDSSSTESSSPSSKPGAVSPPIPVSPIPSAMLDLLRSEAAALSSEAVDLDISLDVDSSVLTEGVEGEGGEEADTEALREEVKRLRRMHTEQRTANAQLLVKVQGLRGSINVLCRIRPPTKGEVEAQAKVAVEALGMNEVGIWDKHAKKWKSLVMDRVLGPEAQQRDVFAELEPLALSAVDCHSACILAYGQTGSGKTYTMMGRSVSGQYGISYRVLHKLFDVLNLKAAEQAYASAQGQAEQWHTYTVRVAMMEIYNEEVRDLLVPSASTGGNNNNNNNNSSSSSKKLDIRKGNHGMMEVPGLSFEQVNGLQDVMRVLQRGSDSRAVAKTDVHDDSSRSHSILMVEVVRTTTQIKNAAEAGGAGAGQGEEGGETEEETGRLFLVDLAGSERVKKSGVTGAELKEATHINTSLSALGDVMQALDSKAKHIPYRNSKLTYLLQDALGGGACARTAMVVTVCPTELTLEESTFTLQFANRVRHIELGKGAQRNVQDKNLAEEVQRLKALAREVAREKEVAESGLVSLQREHKRSQAKMSSLLDTRSRSVQELRKTTEGERASLRAQLEDAQSKLVAERQGKSKVLGDREEMSRQISRLTLKLEVADRTREEGRQRVAEKDSEISQLRAELRATRAEVRDVKRSTSSPAKRPLLSKKGPPQHQQLQGSRLRPGGRIGGGLPSTTSEGVGGGQAAAAAAAAAGGGGAGGAGAGVGGTGGTIRRPSASQVRPPSAGERRQAALDRHHERMRKIHEARADREK